MSDMSAGITYMAMHIACSCGATLEVPDRSATDLIRCTSCGRDIAIAASPPRPDNSRASNGGLPNGDASAMAVMSRLSSGARCTVPILPRKRLWLVGGGALVLLFLAIGIVANHMFWLSKGQQPPSRSTDAGRESNTPTYSSARAGVRAPSDNKQVWAESNAAKCVVHIAKANIVATDEIKEVVATLSPRDDMAEFKDEFARLTINAIRNDQQAALEAVMGFAASLHTTLAGDGLGGLDVSFHLVRSLRKDWPVSDFPLTWRLTGRRVETTRPQDSSQWSPDMSKGNRQLEYQILLTGDLQTNGSVSGNCSGRLTISRGQTAEIVVCFKDAKFELLVANLDMAALSGPAVKRK